MGRKCWTQHSNSRARSTLLSEKHRKFNTERPPAEENENPSIKTRFFPPSGAETSKAVSQIVLGDGTKQSSDHVERADAEQEGAAPGGTRDDVMSQVSGGRGGHARFWWAWCVCVCVFGLVEIKRYFFVGGTNEARRRNFQIQNQRHFSSRGEKSRAPLEHFWQLSSSQRTKQAAIPLWPFLDTHFNEMSKMGDNCITHTKSRVNPIV